MNECQINAFWSKVAITKSIKECWEWIGAKKPKGYGNVRINKQYLIAHKVAFEIINGPIPEGYMVCHICDNPSCCNPYHLMLGTTKSNSADMLIKNRQKSKIYACKGSVNGNSKLTESDVIEIRKLYESKLMNQYTLADKYNVSQTCIGSIVRKQTWRHV